jgi:hypothetical protein
MSLINDALRRAKAVEQNAPAPTHTELRFRPVDCNVIPRRSNARWYLLGLIILLVGAGFIAFQFVGEKNPFKLSPAQPVQARSTVDPAPVSVPPPVAQVAPVPQPAQVSSPALPAAVLSSALAQTNLSVATAETAVAPAAPKAVELKLQAIVFNPRNPSAMINGKTFFVGDKVGDFRLAAVDQETATLVKAGKTNVLALP